MTFNSDINSGNVITIAIVIGGIIVAWVKREWDVTDLKAKIAEVNKNSDARFNENKEELHGLAEKVQVINEHGSPSSDKEIEFLHGLIKEHGLRLSVLEGVKSELAMLAERTSNILSTQNDIKDQIKILAAAQLATQLSAQSKT